MKSPTATIVVSAPPPNQFTVLVLNSSGGAIAGATVMYGAVSQLTASDGTTTFLLAGAQPLTVSAAGYATYTNSAFTPVGGTVFTVTLQTIPPPPPPGGGGPNTIGYIGASLTGGAVQGYNMVPSKLLFWNPAYDVSSGTIDHWASLTISGSPNPYWAAFDNQIAKFGQPKAIWIEICEHAIRPLTYAGDVVPALGILRSKCPNSIFYIGPENDWSPFDLCPVTGPNGYADTLALANQAVANGLGLLGPVGLGPLTAAISASGCDPTTAGKILLGQQLAAFFDSIVPLL